MVAQPKTKRGLPFSPRKKSRFKKQASILFVAIVQLLSSSSDGQLQPNIILINLDDADSEMFELSFADQLYPNIMDVAKKGITFTNMHVTTPFCGPSRACLYRGQYAHNTGICVNQPGVQNSHNFNGGFKYYREQGYFNDDLSTWMQDAGYRTIMVGKFLHHEFEKIIPSGWDDFHSYLGGRYFGTIRFTNEHSAEGVIEQIEPNVYRTVAETEDAIRLLREHAAREGHQPFFLNLNPYGPHRASPASTEMVETHKQGWWTNMLQPYSAAYDERDFDDKRGHFLGLPRIPEWGHAFVHTHYRERALATSSCDDMVGRIRETLANLGLDQNTYVFITSDNGFSLGHHRTLGKGMPIDRCTRVPFFVMGPGIPAGRTANHLLAHIDLAPTLVALAKGTTPDFVDGRSFTNLLTPTGIDTHAAFKQALLVENWSTIHEFDSKTFGASTTLRMVDSVYTEWANGDKDFYDLKIDPQQLNNTYDQLAPILQEFFAFWLRSLRNPDFESKARFSTPYLRGQAIATGSDLRGLAEDPWGVKHVRLAICDVDTNRYWNGSAWQDSFKQVEAELENPNGQITFWNYRSMPNGSNVVSGQVAAWAWAFDENFRQTPPTLALLAFDQTPPELTLNIPAQDQRFSGPAFFQGTAKDGVAVEQVRIFIRNAQTDYYWNGEDFQITQVYVVARPDNKDEWGLMESLPAGTYDVTVQAVDQSGNSSEPELVRPFDVD